MKRWNLTLALILTRGIQRWSPNINKFKIWPRQWRHNPPGPKKGQKQITSQIIEIKSWNLTLALILTRGIQWWRPNIKKYKIWPRQWRHNPPGPKKGQKQITSQIIEIKSWNLSLALILTRGIQWWSPNISKISKFDPVSDVTIPRDEKRSKANNFTNNWNKKLKLDTYTNFDTRNSVMKPKYLTF